MNKVCWSRAGQSAKVRGQGRPEERRVGQAAAELGGHCLSGTGGGFVRRPDGSTFATADYDGVPLELMLALEHASRQESRPLAVEAAFAPDERTTAAHAFGKSRELNSRPP